MLADNIGATNKNIKSRKLMPRTGVSKKWIAKTIITNNSLVFLSRGRCYIKIERRVGKLN